MMRLVVIGTEFPGRTFCSADGAWLDDVCVGIQVGNEPQGLVVGDATTARWEAEVRTVCGDDGSFDFRGPAIHGKRGERFVYLTWGNVTAAGKFEMFRRAKLMLHRVDVAVVREAIDANGAVLEATVRLTDECGGPRCARVEPPAISWRVSYL